jgi:transcription elongation factor B subunit 1
MSGSSATASASASASSEAIRAKYVKLISMDEHEFIAERAVVSASPTIRAMLEGGFAESSGVVRFPELPAAVLERVLQYFHYRARYAGATGPVPDFHVSPKEALELLVAANYLDC